MANPIINNKGMTTIKKRLIAAAIAAVIGCYLSLIGAYNLHMLLSKCQISTLNPFVAMSVFAIPTARGFFLLMFAAVLLAITWMLVGRSYIKYKSDMYEVTPDIRIPLPEGQGQYGTAWFLSPKKYDQAFKSVAIDTDSELIQNLLEHGYDDLSDNK